MKEQEVITQKQNPENRKEKMKPIFDREDFSVRIGGDESFCRNILNHFSGHLMQEVEKLKTALNKNDMKMATIQAHSIKGMAANISAHRLRDVAYKAEMAAKQGEPGKTRLLTDRMEQSAKELLAFLRDSGLIDSSPDLPEQISVIDTGKGIKRAAGNIGLYHELLMQFHQDYKDAADKLRESPDSGNMTNVRLLLHTLKGVAGNMGAMDLYQKTEELERAAKENRAETDGGLVKKFESSLRQVFEFIEERAEEYKVKLCTPEGTDIEKIKAIVSRLAEFLEDGDVEAFELLEELKKYLAPADFDKELTILEKNMDDYNFEEAGKQLAHIVEKIGME